MNYGYALLSTDGKLINLEDQDEQERFPLQLYHFITFKMGNFVNMNNKKILEIGSGRGGGLSYLTRTGKPDKAIGVDFARSQVEFCNRVHSEVEGLNFLEGNAEQIQQVGDNVGCQQFDYVINVESSHCYGNIESFFQSVNWAMKPDGRFFFTDFRADNEINQLEMSIQKCGLEIIKKENITPNVIQALKFDTDRRNNLIQNQVHCLFRSLFKKFSGVEGSRIYKEFEQGKTLYLAYTMRKKRE